MLFNSLEFALFLPLTFLVYWLIGPSKVFWQNVFILFTSYIFYGFWDWRFLILILLSSLIDYYAGLKIYNSKTKMSKKLYLYFSLFWNLGVLFIFKYFNFFTDNLIELFQIDSAVWRNSIEIILPVGLSFYTFQTISYSIDVYREKIKPTRDIVQFLCFVSFFPQLVAGPIERASALLPQFNRKRYFDLNLAKEGMRQILWGLFKKIVVADNLALAVNEIFASPENFQSAELIYALVLFYFQIYCDFSGYADIAIGTAKLFGFKLNINFKTPYLASSIPDFWRRWNITLTKWFRDYIHIPLLKNGNRSFLNHVYALLITFTLIGIWHGANWTFILFGVIHSIYMILDKVKFEIIKTNSTFSRLLKNIPNFIYIFLTFSLATFSIIFFRAPNLEVAWIFIERIFSLIPDDNFKTIIGLNFLFLPLFLIIETLTSRKEFPLINLQLYIPKIARWGVYYIFVYFIIRYGGPKESFIYFQF